MPAYSILKNFINRVIAFKIIISEIENKYLFRS